MGWNKCRYKQHKGFKPKSKDINYQLSHKYGKNIYDLRSFGMHSCKFAQDAPRCLGAREREAEPGWQQLSAHLVEVYHDVALGSAAAHNALQHQGEEQAPGLGHVQVVGVVLVPVLDGHHHLVVVRADDLQVLDK